MLRTGKSALRGLRPRSLTGYRLIPGGLLQSSGRLLRCPATVNEDVRAGNETGIF